MRMRWLLTFLPLYRSEPPLRLLKLFLLLADLGWRGPIFFDLATQVLVLIVFTCRLVCPGLVTTMKFADRVLKDALRIQLKVEPARAAHRSDERISLHGNLSVKMSWFQRVMLLLLLLRRSPPRGELESSMNNDEDIVLQPGLDEIVTPRTCRTLMPLLVMTLNWSRDQDPE